MKIEGSEKELDDVGFNIGKAMRTISWGIRLDYSKPYPHFTPVEKRTCAFCHQSCEAHEEITHRDHCMGKIMLDAVSEAEKRISTL